MEEAEGRVGLGIGVSRKSRDFLLLYMTLLAALLGVCSWVLITALWWAALYSGDWTVRLVFNKFHEAWIDGLVAYFGLTLSILLMAGVWRHSLRRRYLMPDSQQVLASPIKREGYWECPRCGWENPYSVVVYKCLGPDCDYLYESPTIGMSAQAFRLRFPQGRPGRGTEGVKIVDTESA